MSSVSLAGQTWRIVAPPVPVQLDLIMAMGENRHRCAAAALALSLVDEKGNRFAPRLSYAGCGCNPAVFGGLVIEHCHKQSIPLRDWYDAGLIALAEVTAGYDFGSGNHADAPTAAEVEAAADFTGAPPEGDTSQA